MSWLLVLPLTLLAAVVLVAPGAGMGWAVGIRGTATFLVGPAITVSLISVLAVLLAWLRIPWSLLSFLVACLVVMAAAVVVRRLVERRTGELRLRVDGLNLRTFGLGLALWTAMIGYPMIRLFRNSNAIIQSYDNVFHLNVVQYILDTGQASSLTVGGLTSGGGPAGFYPAGWHGFASLVLGSARTFAPGTGVGFAVNAATLAMLVFAWAAGCLFVTQVLAGGRLGVSLLATATLGSLYAFPWIFFPEGGLYPNLLGNSLMMGSVAWLFLLARVGSPATGRQVRLQSTAPVGIGVVCVVLQLPGIALAHPSSLFMLAVFGLAIAWARWVGWERPRGSQRRSMPALGVLIGATVIFGAAWVGLAPTRPTAAREPTGLASATWGLLQGAMSDGGRAAPTLTVLVIAGLVVAVLRRQLANLLVAGVAAVIYVLALGGPTGPVSKLAGGLLYVDSERIAAFAVLAAIPAVLGALGEVDELVWKLTARLAPLARGAARLGIVIALALVLAVPLQVWTLSPMIARSSSRLVILNDKSRRMSTDEYKLISRMRQLVPPGEKVIANPTTGGGFIYALTGVPLVFPHAFLTDSPAMRQLRSQMFNPDQLAATCAAMDELGAHYFYFPGRFIFHPTEGVDAFPGLDEPNLKMLKRVAREGDAKLYRFTACDR